MVVFTICINSFWWHQGRLIWLNEYLMFFIIIFIIMYGKRAVYLRKSDWVWIRLPRDACIDGKVELCWTNQSRSARGLWILPALFYFRLYTFGNASLFLLISIYALFGLHFTSNMFHLTYRSYNSVHLIYFSICPCLFLRWATYWDQLWIL